MSGQRNSEESWQEISYRLVRSLFEDDSEQSPEFEEEERSLTLQYEPVKPTALITAPDIEIEECPPLIIEKEPNKHDEPEEFYDNLVKKMRKLYKRLLIDNTYDFSNLSSSSCTPEKKVCNRRTSSDEEYEADIEVIDKIEGTENVLKSNTLISDYYIENYDLTVHKSVSGNFEKSIGDCNLSKENSLCSDTEEPFEEDYNLLKYNYTSSDSEISIGEDRKLQINKSKFSNTEPIIEEAYNLSNDLLKDNATPSNTEVSDKEARNLPKDKLISSNTKDLIEEAYNLPKDKSISAHYVESFERVHDLSKSNSISSNAEESLEVDQHLSKDDAISSNTKDSIEEDYNLSKDKSISVHNKEPFERVHDLSKCNSISSNTEESLEKDQNLSKDDAISSNTIDSIKEAYKLTKDKSISGNIEEPIKKNQDLSKDDAISSNPEELIEADHNSSRDNAVSSKTEKSIEDNQIPENKLLDSSTEQLIEDSCSSGGSTSSKTEEFTKKDNNLLKDKTMSIYSLQSDKDNSLENNSSSHTAEELIEENNSFSKNNSNADITEDVKKDHVQNKSSNNNYNEESMECKNNLSEVITDESSHQSDNSNDWSDIDSDNTVESYYYDYKSRLSTIPEEGESFDLSVNRITEETVAVTPIQELVTNTENLTDILQESDTNLVELEENIVSDINSQTSNRRSVNNEDQEIEVMRDLRQDTSVGSLEIYDRNDSNRNSTNVNKSQNKMSLAELDFTNASSQNTTNFDKLMDDSSETFKRLSDLNSRKRKRAASPPTSNKKTKFQNELDNNKDLIYFNKSTLKDVFGKMARVTKSCNCTHYHVKKTDHAPEDNINNSNSMTESRSKEMDSKSSSTGYAKKSFTDELEKTDISTNTEQEITATNEQDVISERGDTHSNVVHKMDTYSSISSDVCHTQVTFKAEVHREVSSSAFNRDAADENIGDGENKLEDKSIQLEEYNVSDSASLNESAEVDNDESEISKPTETHVSKAMQDDIRDSNDLNPDEMPTPLTPQPEPDAQETSATNISTREETSSNEGNATDKPKSSTETSSNRTKKESTDEVFYYLIAKAPRDSRVCYIS